MSVTNATFFAIRGQELRIPCRFRDNQGDLITNWTGASAVVYPDNGNGVAATIAEDPIGSGVGTIDIPATATACSMAPVVATIANSGWTAFTGYFFTLNLAAFGGRWDTQAPLVFEQMLKQALYLYGEYGAQCTTLAETIYDETGIAQVAKTITQETESFDSPTPNPGVTISTEWF
jgi:hypothetical protein